jgi:hypothetical protein
MGLSLFDTGQAWLTACAILGLRKMCSGRVFEDFIALTCGTREGYAVAIS